MSYEGFRWITKTCKLKKKFKYPVYLIHKKKLCWSQYHSQMSYYIDTILILCRFMFLSPWMTDSDTFFSFPQTTWENKISLREKKKNKKTQTANLNSEHLNHSLLLFSGKSIMISSWIVCLNGFFSSANQFSSEWFRSILMMALLDPRLGGPFRPLLLGWPALLPHWPTPLNQQV